MTMNWNDVWTAPEGVNPLKFKIGLWYKFFDSGYAMTNPLKYIIALFGLSSQDVWFTMIAGVSYLLFCIGFGYLFHKYGWATIMQETANKFNIFVGEMRELKNRV